jgi:alkanesulfonate monooxygenase SsuD/methylene tetrahydromethanopterin reductase-like flavin-dependent oxidoreductase (luciferase family)
MKFGIDYFPDADPDRVSGRQYFDVLELNDITYERVLDETRALIGDPDDVARQLTYIRDTFGEVYPSFQINFGMMDKAKARRSVELFARHVMPRFR